MIANDVNPGPLNRIVGRILCFFGIHSWNGGTDPDCPTPRCRRCGRWYAPRNVVQKNIVAGGDVCAGNIYRARFYGHCRDCRRINACNQSALPEGGCCNWEKP